MVVRVRLIILIFLLILGVSFLGWQKTLAQSDVGEYVVETGHWVTGEFRITYKSKPNYLQLYGYPITDAFADPNTGKLVQYFQKARFELNSDSSSGQRVEKSPLGEYIYKQGQPLPIPENSPACRLFPQSGFQVCYAFLDFFNANGGEEQFGSPISNIELHNDRMVQYFQNARFEWHPQRPPGQRVVLADLGAQYFYIHGEDPVRIKSAPGDPTIEGILSLQVRAFTEQAVTSENGVQIIYIIVQDQRLEPVKNATVALSVKLPSGEEQEILVKAPTNSQGITQHTIKFESQPVGEAEIEAIARHENLEAKTVTSFRVWW